MYIPKGLTIEPYFISMLTITMYFTINIYKRKYNINKTKNTLNYF